jgi:hypothetical protein
MRRSTCWVRHDAGEGNYVSTFRDRGDCTVRALATARAMPYGEAWHQLYTLQGELRTTSFALSEWLRVYPGRFGVLAEETFPAVCGRPRMTGAKFCAASRQGRFVLSMAHHVAAVVEGQLFDTWNSSTRCVYRAWRLAPWTATGLT